MPSWVQGVQWDGRDPREGWGRKHRQLCLPAARTGLRSPQRRGSEQRQPLVLLGSGSRDHQALLPHRAERMGPARCQASGEGLAGRYQHQHPAHGAELLPWWVSEGLQAPHGTAGPAPWLPPVGGISLPPPEETKESQSWGCSRWV